MTTDELVADGIVTLDYAMRFSERVPTDLEQADREG